MLRKSLKDLVNKEESAWTVVTRWVKEAENQVLVLPASEPARSEALGATQVSTKSPMGAVVYESGGILVDHGWLRILGSGHPKMARSVPGWNRAVGNDLSIGVVPYLLIADDVTGGFFALDGGVLGKPGSVFYHAPDTLHWEDTGKGYGDFLYWCLSGDLQKYYTSCRWPSWETEIADLDGDQGISVYPFLWAEGPPISFRQRRIAPISEIYRFHVKDLTARHREQK